ncbi:MAG: hypothetical protein J6I84_04340 [Bacilli bacterium]|nr:hypothetical protein [Bacilli bacterium]
MLPYKIVWYKRRWYVLVGRNKKVLITTTEIARRRKKLRDPWKIMSKKATQNYHLTGKERSDTIIILNESIKYVVSAEGELYESCLKWWLEHYLPPKWIDTKIEEVYDWLHL